MIKQIKLFINTSLTNFRIGAHRAYIQLEYMLYNRDSVNSTCNLLIEIY